MRAASGWMVGLVSIALVAGCGGSPESGGDSDEENLTSGATRIASGLESPSTIHISGDLLIFSTAHFVGSGDPELDQQFAHWEGQLWKKPMKSGAKKKIDD